MNSFTEENYLKAIFKLTSSQPKGVSTNSIAGVMDTKASSVTDMMKKLAIKNLINYKKYQGVTLTKLGRLAALSVIRKHRLWECFLVDNLGFKWDDVHDIAEQMEHIKSDRLINKLDEYLNYPKYDPHGDPVPDANGNIIHHKETCLVDLKPSEKGIVVGVKDSSARFLQYLEKMNLILGAKVVVKDVIEYDQSMSVLINNEKIKSISEIVSKNLYIKKIK